LKIKSEKDFWSGLMFLVVGAALPGARHELQLRLVGAARPGLLSRSAWASCGLLGAILLFKALTSRPRRRPHRPLAVQAGRLGAGRWCCSAALLPRLGMAIALPLLIGVGSLASGEFRWKEVLVNSIVLTVGSWARLHQGPGLTIPLWPTFITG
jgi:hypothetical protein